MIPVPATPDPPDGDKRVRVTCFDPVTGESETQLDDGERLEFDRVELLSALGSAIAGDMGRLRAA